MPGTATTVPCRGLPRTLTVTSCLSPLRRAGAGGTAHLHLPAWGHQPNHWPEDSAPTSPGLRHMGMVQEVLYPTLCSPLLPVPAVPAAPHLLLPHLALVPLTPTAHPRALPSADPSRAQDPPPTQELAPLHSTGRALGSPLSPRDGVAAHALAALPPAARQQIPHPSLSCNFIFSIKLSVLFPQWLLALLWGGMRSLAGLGGTAWLMLQGWLARSGTDHGELRPTIPYTHLQYPRGARTLPPACTAPAGRGPAPHTGSPSPACTTLSHCWARTVLILPGEGRAGERKVPAGAQV